MTAFRHPLRALRRTIGFNIHAVRRKRRISLWKMEKMTGVPARMLDQFELGKGEVRLDDLVAIAAVLGVDVAHFLELRDGD